MQDLQNQSAIRELFLRNIRNNTVINLAVIPDFNIEAQCSADTARCFFLVKDQNTDILNRTENVFPYFLGGDNRPPNTTLFGVSLSPGEYSL